MSETFKTTGDGRKVVAHLWNELQDAPGFISLDIVTEDRKATVTNIGFAEARRLGNWLLENTPEPEPEPTFKELWDALPIGARVPGSSGDRNDWVKVSKDAFIFYGGASYNYRIDLYRDLWDEPIINNWYDLTERSYA